MRVKLKNKNRKNRIKSTEKTFKVLEEIADQEGRASLGQITQEIKIPKSTVHRILNTLLDMGYIQQDSGSGDYELGLKFLHLSSVILQSLDLRETARPILKQLSRKTNMTANLVVMEEGEALYVETEESSSMLRIFSLIGKRAPLHATGVGKVLLADLEWEDVQNIISEKGLQELTPHTITEPDSLKRELEDIREKGYALDREECELGAMCIAAPVKNHLKKTVSAISISAPKNKFNNQKKLNKYVSKVKKHAEELSELLGKYEV